VELPLVILGVGALALLVTALLLRSRVADPRPPSTSVAVAYLDALARGDADAARAMFDPSRSQRAAADLTDPTTFTSAAALGNATELISEIAIGVTAGARYRPRSFVYFSYTLDGRRFENQMIALRWAEGSWTIDEGLFEKLQVEPYFDEVAAPTTMRVILGRAEAVVPIPPAHRVEFLAYPARYPLMIGADGWLLDAASRIPETVTLVPTGSSELVVPRFGRGSAETSPPQGDRS
jgi:hypothetical protein